MKPAKLYLLTLLLLPVAAATAASCPETLAFSPQPLGGGAPVNLCESYRGKVVLIVNTASRCGLTPQYEGLESLYRRYRDRGLTVLGFPSNDFGGQEPGSEEEIKGFCRLSYGVQFPMFEKIHAAEGKADPIYRVLAERAGEYPQWNFHKYLLDRNGNLVASFPSRTTPEDPKIVAAIERLL